MSSRTEREKFLVEEYKRQPKKIGAYCIRNTQSQKCYVGVSRDVDARLNRHRFALRSNTENLSAELQQDWNKLGAEMFEFTILDTIEPPKDLELDYDPSEDLIVLELLWLEQCKSFAPNGYNKPK
tara:strand:- start:11544 stop:11918 length:375 start_codon:yes stop_codon:yes gene_type:complete